MKNPSMRALAAATLILAAFVRTGAASATELYVGDTPLGLGGITASLKSTTSALLKDKNGTTEDTCTASTMKMKIERDTGSGWNPSGKVSTLTFTGCTHTTTVLNPGSLTITWTSGTNGSVSSSGAEVTVKSTIFGVSAICKTSAGTTIGTLTGTSSGNATMDINASTLDCGVFGTSTWTGTYTITLPTVLGVEFT